MGGERRRWGEEGGGGEDSGNYTCTQQAGLVACQRPAYAIKE